jgi:hypothetical protein
MQKEEGRAERESSETCAHVLPDQETANPGWWQQSNCTEIRKSFLLAEMAVTGVFSFSTKLVSMPRILN